MGPLNYPLGRGQPAQLHNAAAEQEDFDQDVDMTDAPTATADNTTAQQQRPPMPTAERAGRQWRGQPWQPQYSAACKCRVGHYAENCCKHPPSKADLQLLQPGHDGSVIDKLSGGAHFTDAEKAANPWLLRVAEWVTEHLALKLQHSMSVRAYNNFSASWINNPDVAAEFRAALREHASTYDRGLAFLQKMGAEVR